MLKDSRAPALSQDQLSLFRATTSPCGAGVLQLQAPPVQRGPTPKPKPRSPYVGVRRAGGRATTRSQLGAPSELSPPPSLGSCHETTPVGVVAGVVSGADAPTIVSPAGGCASGAALSAAAAAAAAAAAERSAEHEGSPKPNPNLYNQGEETPYTADRTLPTVFAPLPATLSQGDAAARTQHCLDSVPRSPAPPRHLCRALLTLRAPPLQHRSGTPCGVCTSRRRNTAARWHARAV